DLPVSGPAGRHTVVHAVGKGKRLPPPAAGRRARGPAPPAPHRPCRPVEAVGGEDVDQHAAVLAAPDQLREASPLGPAHAAAGGTVRIRRQDAEHRSGHGLIAPRRIRPGTWRNAAAAARTATASGPSPLPGSSAKRAWSSLR